MEKSLTNLIRFQQLYPSQMINLEEFQLPHLAPLFSSAPVKLLEHFSIQNAGQQLMQKLRIRYPPHLINAKYEKLKKACLI